MRVEREMPNAAYHASEAVSKSHLDAINRSPRHYWAKYLDPNRAEDTPTPAMLMGSAVHMAVLEPDLFVGRYVQAPAGIDKRTKDGKAAWADFEASVGDRLVLNADEYQQCIAIRDAVRGHEVAAKLLDGGEAEVSYFVDDEQTGLPLKARPDFRNAQNIVVDLKTTEDAGPSAFGKSSANFRYHVQAAWYSDIVAECVGENVPWFFFVVVEKKPPYAVGLYYCEPDVLALGRKIARRNLDAIARFREAGNWPDYADEPQPLRLPKWALLDEEAPV